MNPFPTQMPHRVGAITDRPQSLLPREKPFATPVILSEVVGVMSLELRICGANVMRKPMVFVMREKRIATPVCGLARNDA